MLVLAPQTRIRGRDWETMKDKMIDNWLSLAQYDLATAEAMLHAQRYLYVGFMCQQAVEKILKASYVKHHGSTPPYTHNLLRLVAELPWKEDMDAEMTGVLEEAQLLLHRIPLH